MSGTFFGNAVVWSCLGLFFGISAQPAELPTGRVGQLETVATFNGSMPTGVTVAHNGRIFVNFPRWGDPVPFTVAELKNGNAVAYPNTEINRLDTNHAA